MRKVRLCSGVLVAAFVYASFGVEQAAAQEEAPAPAAEAVGAPNAASPEADPANALTPKQLRANRSFDLWARHPDLFEHPEFRRWSSSNKLHSWHETAPDEEGTQTVTIVSTDPDRLLAVRIEETPGALTRERVLQAEPIDLSQTPLSRERLNAALRLDAESQKKLFVRPRISFRHGEPSVALQVQLPSAERVRLFELDGAGELQELEVIEVPIHHNIEEPDEAPPSEPVSANLDATDDLATNELHHPAQMRAEAEEWTRELERKDWAEAIYNQVKDFTYDGDVSVANFTWADIKSRQRERINVHRWDRGAGVCDEYAVLAISYLRALGVPARLTYVMTNVNGWWAHHAVVEYFEENDWKHMDPQGKQFNARAHYRSYPGAIEVKVTDATFPDDTLSSDPIRNIDDPNGDNILAPWDDFVIRPDYPGKHRPGYSVQTQIENP